MGKKKCLTPPRVVLDSNCVILALIFSNDLNYLALTLLTRTLNNETIVQAP